jgi:hypothetical protein
MKVWGPVYARGPWMQIRDPVTNRASSPQSHATHSATSWPQDLVRFVHAGPWRTISLAAASDGYGVYPGATTFDVTPWSASARAILYARASRATLPTV